MAKVRNNIIIQGLSGSLGEQLVIKQDKAGRTIVGVAPSFDPNRTASLRRPNLNGRGNSAMPLCMQKGRRARACMWRRRKGRR